ncbi:MAG TPA: hypothetical protein VFI54_11070 [Solirubrobacteraceae bacterium]|nr:hypothetical protein [Solirubrobacteraceae bacterium]
MKRIRRYGAVAAAAAALGGAALAAGGCGAANTIDPVAKAASVSTTTPGFQMRFELRFGSPQLPTALTATGSGSINARERTGSVVFVMNAGNDPDLKKALGGSTLRLEELVDGTTVYVKLPPAIASKLPGGRPWIKVDLAKASGIPGFSSLANNPVSSDPSQFLSYLRATSGTVSKQGSAVVNGIQTTHYHATISLDKVPDALPSGSRKGAKQAVSSIEQLTGLRQLPVDAWIDGNNLIRRMRLSFAESLAPSVKLNIAMTMNFVKYGPQPKPTFPSADQVSDASSFSGVGG